MKLVKAERKKGMEERKLEFGSWRASGVGEPRKENSLFWEGPRI